MERWIHKIVNAPRFFYIKPEIEIDLAHPSPRKAKYIDCSALPRPHLYVNHPPSDISYNWRPG